jgi:hypothetical protein
MVDLIITIAISVAAAYLGWLFGRRWERGRIEMERDAHMEKAAKRAERTGAVRMNTIQIRR